MRSSSKSAAAAAPTSLTSPKSSATKRQRKAAPLGDVTNLLVAAAEAPTPSSSKPRRTASQSLPAPSDVSAVSSTCSSSASVTLVPKPSAPASATPARKPSAAASTTPARKRSSAAGVVTPARKPSSAACFVTPAPKPSSAACFVTPAPKPSSAVVIQEERSVLKSPTISTVYRRTTEAQGRWRRNPAAANSKGKEPVAATASCRPPHGKSARTTQSRKKETLISASAPCHEGKKKRSITSTPSLLEDLLEKQRAYFADIDAFELVEEEASESELE